MKIVTNAGSDTVLAALHRMDAEAIDVATPGLSLFGFEELAESGVADSIANLVLPVRDWPDELLGSPIDRERRNRLLNRAIARDMLGWLDAVTIRTADSHIPQALTVGRNGSGDATNAISGSYEITTSGLGVSAGRAFSLIAEADSPSEVSTLASFFDQQRNAAVKDPENAAQLRSALENIAAYHPVRLVYGKILAAIFENRGHALDEDDVVDAATGIRETKVWQKLYKFQRDGVVGALDKLNRFGGCIIADSVGLGKTFEALAVIKYHELRNDRVLVLCPKRLRDNWTLYAANDRRNVLADDRFNYDVLNHTDLSRDVGMSGDIDLSHVNWGNYDLVVIDESHNFRNKTLRTGGETRYDRLMRQIVRDGVKTRVLMLSATPVNNRLSDLRNQIAFATEGRDDALVSTGVRSIEATTSHAQKQFNEWLELNSHERTQARLIEMLGYGYFALLDALTIARSRRHVEKYYGTEETGTFPTRLPPINKKPDFDLLGKMPSISDINDEIRRLTLASYAPLRYVLPHKKEEYRARYSQTVGGGRSEFRQEDREESLVHLMRINMLKRLESSIHSFRLTLQRQLAKVDSTLRVLEQDAPPEFEGLQISDVDIDDPLFETLLVGDRVKVLVADVDQIRWRQDLDADKGRLEKLIAAAEAVTPHRDAKLDTLRSMIHDKLKSPLNDGNRKVIIFTAFQDTAQYLFDNLADWARADHGIESALITGSGTNQTTAPSMRKDLGTLLTAFAPIAKERPVSLADSGDIDLLIATDCISEGQNLQDCDWLVNYDIHWNPVRIVQRFGRIDRIGSPNDSIQLVNLWPNLELEEYINLEQRVSGRMVLLDISATGEENLIETQSGNQMNDLDYRREQLQRLQETVIDLEDVANSVSITDLTLTEFRIDLSEITKSAGDRLHSVPDGAISVTVDPDSELGPGYLFCLRASPEVSEQLAGSDYPLAPLFLAYVLEDGTVALSHSQAKSTLDLLRRLGTVADLDEIAVEHFDGRTKSGRNMNSAHGALVSMARSIIGKGEERSVETLFSKGGTITLEGEFEGTRQFEVVAWVAIQVQDR